MLTSGRAKGQINADMMPVNPHATRKRKTEEGNILFALENNQDAKGKPVVNVSAEAVNQPLWEKRGS